MIFKYCIKFCQGKYRLKKLLYYSSQGLKVKSILMYNKCEKLANLMKKLCADATLPYLVLNMYLSS